MPYLCIDLKSYFASVECVERGLDPMTAKLVVADPERGQGTLCLAVTPALKAMGVRNRCRVMEIPKHISYIMAPPRMQKYIDYAAEVYGVYLRYLAPEDIHVYSIDEAFLDIGPYLSMYRLTPKQLGLKLMGEVEKELGLRATCGVGSNLYLAKVALDILAKHAADFVGVLDEDSYCRQLWEHRPLTDFWRVGPGIAARLAHYGILTMGQIARAPQELIYKLFGVDGELLIDHAWGREPVTMAHIKAYRPRTHSVSQGQVLLRDYSFREADLIVREMADNISLELVARGLVAGGLCLYVGYSHVCASFADAGLDSVPPPTRVSVKLECMTNTDTIIMAALSNLYRSSARRDLPIRRINITCTNAVSTRECPYQQPDLFSQGSLFDMQEKRGRLQKAVLSIKRKFGKNSLFKGMNLEEASTALERNRQIGGHKSGENA